MKVEFGSTIGQRRERKGGAMFHIHCQVRFVDYEVWKASMDADGHAQREAGIHLKYLWRGTDDPSMAFFVCDVEDKDKARAFLNPADIAEAEKGACASDFCWHFVEEVMTV
jgi:hypothetical protein